MISQSATKLRIQYIILGFILFMRIEQIVSTTTDCNKADSVVLCHGAKAIRNVMHHVVFNKNGIEQPLKILPGLEIVPLRDDSILLSDNPAGRSNTQESDTYLGRVAKYLSSHELKIRLSDIIQKSDFNEVLATTLKGINEEKGVVEGRKKDKGGLGYVLMMGLMMGKMMAALGFGGVAALAMKALGVSMMALMLAAIVGIKKLADSGHDDSSHQVHYVTAHSEHHRKRRDIDQEVPLPYRGYIESYKKSK